MLPADVGNYLRISGRPFSFVTNQKVFAASGRNSSVSVRCGAPIFSNPFPAPGGGVSCGHANSFRALGTDPSGSACCGSGINGCASPEPQFGQHKGSRIWHLNHPGEARGVRAAALPDAGGAEIVPTGKIQHPRRRPRNRFGAKSWAFSRTEIRRSRAFRRRAMDRLPVPRRAARASLSQLKSQRRDSTSATCPSKPRRAISSNSSMA